MDAQTEIVEQHRFIEAWLRGEADVSALPAFIDTHTPDFQLHGPDGTVAGRDDIEAGLRAGHGAAPGVEVRVRAVEVVAASADVVVAGYEEHQETTSSRSARRSTAAFVADPAARHGLRWRRLHEAWLTSAPATRHDGRPRRGEVEARWVALIEGALTREEVHAWAVPWVEGDPPGGPAADPLVESGLQILHGFSMAHRPSTPNRIHHGPPGSFVVSADGIRDGLARWRASSAEADQDPAHGGRSEGS